MRYLKLSFDKISHFWRMFSQFSLKCWVFQKRILKIGIFGHFYYCTGRRHVKKWHLGTTFGAQLVDPPGMFFLAKIIVSWYQRLKSWYMAWAVENFQRYWRIYGFPMFFEALSDRLGNREIFQYLWKYSTAQAIYQDLSLWY